MTSTNDLLIQTDEYWLLSETDALWPELLGRHRDMGFITQEDRVSETMIQDFFWIREEASKAMAKVEKKLKSIQTSAPAWLMELGHQIELISNQPCNRRELVVRTMVRDRLSMLYRRLTELAAPEDEGQSSETLFFNPAVKYVDPE